MGHEGKKEVEDLGLILETCAKALPGFHLEGGRKPTTTIEARDKDV